MPSFIAPMAIRFFFVNLGIVVAINIVVGILASYGYVDVLSRTGTSVALILAGGYWAGHYFYRQTGRPAEWAEAWPIGAILALIQAVTDGLQIGLMMLLDAPAADLALLSKADPAILVPAMIFGYLLSLVGLSLTIRSYSKVLVNAEKKKRQG